MKNILLTTITSISLAYSSVNAEQLTQKEKAILLLEKAFSTKQDRSVLNYINEKKYIQHNLGPTNFKAAYHRTLLLPPIKIKNDPGLFF